MTIEAKIIADSISPDFIRLTTMQLKYPRIIHSEFMTHRVFSRNASSSRAIPIKTMIENILADPAMPVRFGANQKGMQDKGGSHDELVGFINPYTGDEEWYKPEEAWNYALPLIAAIVEGYAKAGYHKQIGNRLLEPWSHISVVVTSTEWDNFFFLRDHADADPTIAALASKMRTAYSCSRPDLVKVGQWHLPYITEEELNSGLSSEELVRISTARCARVSYLTHDGREPDQDADYGLFERLMGAQPFHASPAEHQATPDTLRQYDPTAYGRGGWEQPGLHGNFFGWKQHRKMCPGENGGTRT